MKKGTRIGYGYDVHPLGADRRLILGGIEVPHTKACSAILIPMSLFTRFAMPYWGRWGKGISAGTIQVPTPSIRGSPA